MNGWEFADEKQEAPIELEATCSPADNKGTLICNWVTIEAELDKKKCLINIWQDKIKLVHYDKQIAIWANTEGPAGLVGDISTWRLEAKPAYPKKSFADGPPTELDDWAYELTNVPTNPDAVPGGYPKVSEKASSKSKNEPMNCKTRVFYNQAPLG